MNYIDRRGFIRQALVGAGLLAVPWARAGGKAAPAGAPQFGANDRVVLGKTGITTSRMAVGSGTHGWQKSSNQTKLGMDNFVGMIRHGYDRGLTLWDMADQYGSHPYFREALKFVPRDKVTVLTKVWTRDAVGVKQDLERFRSEIGTDTIDILLLHCLTDDNWTEKMKATMDVVSEAREKGVLRTYGVSCHSMGALSAAVDSPWPEVILERINHAGASMDDTPAKVVPLLKKGHDKGKVILGMKIAGVGEIADQIDHSLHFMFSQGFVDAFTMGFESIPQMDDVFGKIEAVRV